MGFQGGRFEKVFGFKRLHALEARISRHKTLTPTDFQTSLNRQITTLAARLALPLARPSWGPALDHDLPEDTHQGGEENFSGVATEHLQAAYENLEQSERYARFSGLYLLVVILGIAIILGALYFDYEIMTEFWTRVFADEFMEVPESLAGSVISKSAQVIFATAAFHFLLSRLSEFGRTLFIWVFFLLTFGMIVGFGLMNANISMPADPEALAPSAPKPPTSIAEALGELGLAKTPEGAPPEEIKEEGVFNFAENLLRQVRPLLWMVVPGLVFLVVTGIGALCLHMTEINLQNFIKSRDWPRRQRRMRELEELCLYKTLVDRLVEAQK